jgi:endonuclease/exonuclease/phosphatase family metal-dependent hydrolase
MNVLKIVFLLLLSISASAGEIKILAWNVFMLPKPIKNSRQKERMVVIKDALSKLDYDVLIFEEAFSDLFRSTVGQGLSQRYPHQIVLGKSTSIKKVMNSGVFMLSKYPMKFLGFRYYSWCGKADCFAAKGVLMVEITLPTGEKVQIAGTHMQAGESESMKEVRTYQADQIKELMDQYYQSSVPQILLGDLNTDALNGTEMPYLLHKLELMNIPLSTGSLNSSKSPKTSCFGKESNGKSEWLDHMLIRGPIEQVQKKLIRIQGMVGGELCDLSDHLPLQGIFKI